MKTIRAKNWTAVCATVSAVMVTFGASADQTATVARPDKKYTGTVIAVDPNEHTLSVKGWTMFNKSFNLGESCAYALLDINSGTAGDLRRGEKVTVSYQNAHGVLIADRIQQQPMRFEGMVTAIAPDKHTLMLHRPGLDKKLEIAADCKIVLRNGNPGTFAGIQPGNHVTVTYETPDDTPMARQIAQTSMAFIGKLTAIDLGEKTLKATALLASKKFNVADHCAIVINGKLDGQLSDLKPNDRLVFNYDEINGVNVVTRIAPAPVEAQTNSTMVTTTPPGYPMGN